MILGHLSPPDVTAFGATCRRYHEQSQNRWVWKSVCSHMLLSEPSEWQRSAIIKYTQALHYQQLRPARCLRGKGGSCSQPSTSRAVDVLKAHGYQRVVPVHDHVVLWDYQGTLHVLKHDGAFPGSLSQHTVLCHNVMDFAVDAGNNARLREYVYVLHSPEYGPQEDPQDGSNLVEIYHLGPEPELILRARRLSQVFTQIRLTGSMFHFELLLLSDFGQVYRYQLLPYLRRTFYDEPLITTIFRGPEDPLLIRQVCSSTNSTLYLSGDGTVHLEVYRSKLRRKMFDREDLPALYTPVLLPLPTKMAVSMMPVDVWCKDNYTLVLLKDESGHKELHGCGCGARGRLPGHPKGSNVLVKLNVQEVSMPEVLYEEVIEVDERVVLQQDGCHLPRRDPKRTVTGSTGDSLEVWKELHLKSVEEDLRAYTWQMVNGLIWEWCVDLYGQLDLTGVVHRGEVHGNTNLNNNTDCTLAVGLLLCLLSICLTLLKEEAVGELARRLGFSQVSLSSEVMPMVRAVPRGYTVRADAYLTPKIRQYLKGFTSGFQGGLKDVDVLFMQSDGGLTPMERFCGLQAMLPGRGGVVGYAVTSYDRAEEKAVIGFDMGAYEN
ncbi:hypothetical protein CRUP_002048 [Coryphaenoides rupestris]|nr:hypothetical protein CRUP_002048 [Coryphaenoides rupestris]